MDQDADLLEQVVQELDRRKGDLRAVASGTGIPYDTVLRIKNRENDPGYSKVRQLAEYFGMRVIVVDAGAPTLQAEARAA